MGRVLSPQQIAANFSKAAETYAIASGPQLEMGKALAQIITKAYDVRAILDVGCGTGEFTRMLLHRFPDARITGIDIAQGMIEHCRKARWHARRPPTFEVMDARDIRSQEAYDLVASSAMLQWAEDPFEVIAWMTCATRRLLAISVPVQGSLVELYESYEAVTGEEFPGLELRPTSLYHEAMVEAGLIVMKMETVTIVSRFTDIRGVFEHFQNLGASMGRIPGGTPLPGATLRQIMRHYEKTYRRPNGHIPLTYKVLVASGVKPP